MLASIGSVIKSRSHQLHRKIYRTTDCTHLHLLQQRIQTSERNAFSQSLDHTGSIFVDFGVKVDETRYSDLLLLLHVICKVSADGEFIC